MGAPGPGPPGPLDKTALVEASNFKFGTQLRFGEYVTIATLVPNLVGVGCATGAPQKLWVSRTTYPVPRNSYSNVIKQQIKCKKPRFRHELTTNDTSKTAKITIR